MQPAVASCLLALALFAAPTNAGVYAPSLLVTQGSNHDEPEDIQIPVVVRVLQHSKASSRPRTRYDCEDDPSWVDEDGDGCAAYADAIASGDITEEVACGFQRPSKNEHYEGDFQGAGVHCPATCGTCPEEPPAAATPKPAQGSASQAQASPIPAQASATAPGEFDDLDAEDDDLGTDGICVDDDTWTDEDGDGCDVYAMHIKNGDIPKSIACGFEEGNAIINNPLGAAQHCRATCGTCDSMPNPAFRFTDIANPDEEIVAESSATNVAESSATGKRTCKDDPNWKDIDGDGCAKYARAIASGAAEQDELCGRTRFEFQPGESGSPSEAGKYCAATCGNCDTAILEDNDDDIKDIVRHLVEQESENILKSAHLQEEEQEEDTPEVTTTTTTEPKKLPEAECSGNCSRMEYWNPEAERDTKELSQTDLLKMASEMQPQQSRVHMRTPLRARRVDLKKVLTDGSFEDEL